jgi:hypothetical protein
MSICPEPAGWSRKQALFALFIIYLLTRLPFLTALPFMKDEGVYSIMIEEQISNPTLELTFLGQPVLWKPPLMFWTYGAFVQFLRGLPIPIEAVYRLPGTFFGFLNTLLVFSIMERALGDRKLAVLGAFVYLTLFVPIHTDSRVLTDTLCGTFVFAGILAYLEGLGNSRFFLVGGVLTFLAYFVKQTNAAIVPLLALALLAEKDRKRLGDPLFLLSLLGFPLAMWLFNMIIGLPPAGDAVFLAENYILGKLDFAHIGGSLLTFFPMAVIWFPLSIFGFFRNWRRNLMMSLWYVLMAFPMVAGGMMPFYFYPVMPAVAFFALQFIIRESGGKIVTDRFFYMIFILLSFTGLVLGAAFNHYYHDVYIEEKAAGEFLAGKENVMIVGDYAPSIPAYKMLEEKRASGRWLDYGMIIFMNISANTSTYDAFIADYGLKGDPSALADGDFTELFSASKTFRKKTGITEFDFICVVGNSSVGPGGRLVLDEPRIQVYDMRQPSGG